MKGSAASSQICSSCHQILQKRQSQNDAENGPQVGADFSVNIKSLISARRLHCYICTTIVDQLQVDSNFQEPLNKTPLNTVIDTEYLLHAALVEGVWETTFELRVNVVFWRTANAKKSVFFKLFVLHPDHRKNAPLLIQ